MIKRYYHYTTIENLKRILNSGCLKPSYFSQHDTMHGEGWYLTDLTPKNSDTALQKVLWNSNVPKKTRCYVAFNIEETLIKQCKSHVYLIKLESIPDAILKLKVKYFENNTYYSLNNAKVVLEYAGYSIRKRKLPVDETDWKPLIQAVKVVIGVVGITVLINAIINSK
jgi:hypothetical protein